MPEAPWALRNVAAPAHAEQLSGRTEGDVREDHAHVSDDGDTARGDVDIAQDAGGVMHSEDRRRVSAAGRQ